MSNSIRSTPADHRTDAITKSLTTFAEAIKNSEGIDGELILAVWRFGLQCGLADSKIKDAARATNGRRLIGATSRAKVAKAAQSFKHLSKSNASYEMAELVNLDPGTIKRYLTELFPGDKWKQ